MLRSSRCLTKVNDIVVIFDYTVLFEHFYLTDLFIIYYSFQFCILRSVCLSFNFLCVFFLIVVCLFVWGKTWCGIGWEIENVYIWVELGERKCAQNSLYKNDIQFKNYF